MNTMSAGAWTFRDEPKRPGIRTGLVAAGVMSGLAHGLSMDQISAATGLRADDLSDPDGWLPETILPVLWRLIASVRPGRPVGLEMAAAAPLSMFGSLAHACRYADTQRAVLQALARYQMTLSDSLSVAFTETPTETRLHLNHVMDERDDGHGADMALAAGIRLRKELSGVAEGLLRVEFRHTPNGPHEVYEDYFDAPVHFEQPSNAMVFATPTLDLPSAEANPQLFHFIESHLRAAKERLLDVTVADELAPIRAAAAHNGERSEYGAEALARRVGMSLRKLQRLVRQHGTTVRALLEETRMTNAQQFLSESRLGVEEIAFLLGYSDDRAFRRAFKRWNGKTPSQYRRDRAAEARAGDTDRANR